MITQKETNESKIKEINVTKNYYRSQKMTQIQKTRFFLKVLVLKMIKVDTSINRTKTHVT